MIMTGVAGTCRVAGLSSSSTDVRSGRVSAGWGSGDDWRAVADGVVPQPLPCWCPGPATGEVEDGCPGGPGQSGGNGDQLSAQGRAPGAAVVAGGEDAGGVEQVVGDCGAQCPGGVCAETS